MVEWLLVWGHEPGACHESGILAKWKQFEARKCGWPNKHVMWTWIASCDTRSPRKKKKEQRCMGTVRHENMNENILKCSVNWHSCRPEWERLDNCCNNDHEQVIHEEEKVYHSATQDDGSVNADDVEFLDANNDEWCEQKNTSEKWNELQKNAAVHARRVWPEPWDERKRHENLRIWRCQK